MSVVEKKINLYEEKPLKEKEIELDEKIDNFEHKTFYQKLCYAKSNITVEPIFCGLVIASMLSRIAVQNLNLDKACRVKLTLGNKICDEMIQRKGNLTYEVQVQQIISAIETWKSIIQTAIPTVLVVFMGAWSDRTGNRKLCILMPVVGECLVCISNLISTYFFFDISIEVTMFLEALLPAITGGWVMVFLGVFSYISDITSDKDRTFRVGLANLCMTAGTPIGTAFSGILLKFWGYYGVFILTGTINVTIFLYGFFYLSSNTKPNNGNKEKVESPTCSDMLSLVKETAEVAFKKRPSNFRKKIILTLLTVAIVYGPNHGERIVFYMYLRYKLKWDAVKYSLYSTYSIITHSLGALFSISIFSKRWGFHDSMLCIISVVSKFAGSMLIAFVQNDIQMYMVPIVEILNATTFTSLRSMASKLVPSEEMGKMNSLFSLVETLAALVFDPIYSGLYSKTVHLFPGAVFIYSAGMTLPAVAILMWLFMKHRTEVKRERKEAREEKEFTLTENIIEKQD